MRMIRKIETEQQRQVHEVAARGVRPGVGCMIWTGVGTWLDAVTPEGRRVSSFVGNQLFDDVEAFCRAHGLELVTV